MRIAPPLSASTTQISFSRVFCSNHFKPFNSSLVKFEVFGCNSVFLRRRLSKSCDMVSIISLTDGSGDGDLGPQYFLWSLEGPLSGGKSISLSTEADDFARFNIRFVVSLMSRRAPSILTAGVGTNPQPLPNTEIAASGISSLMSITTDPSSINRLAVFSNFLLLRATRFL